MKASEVVEAVYERGVFKPSAPVEFSDGQKVLLSIEPVNGKPTGGRDELRRGREVFAGFSDGDVDELDRLILDRTHYMPKSGDGPVRVAFANVLPHNI